MININESWSIARHLHGGFILHKHEPRGLSKKTGKPVFKKDSFYYPKLEMCAAKLVEEGFPNDALDLEAVCQSLYRNTNALCACLHIIFDQMLEERDET